MNQRELPSLIQHQPLQPARKGHIGEVVYAERWIELNTRMPECWYPSDSDEAIEVAMLSGILQNLPGTVGQREASVAASFVTWLGCNIGRSMIDQASRYRPIHSTHSVLVAWAIENARSLCINGGWRTVDYILARPDQLGSSPFAPGSGLVTQPDVTVRDLEVIDQLCIWLGDEGRGFLRGCEVEIVRRQAFQFARERAGLAA